MVVIQIFKVTHLWLVHVPQLCWQFSLDVGGPRLELFEHLFLLLTAEQLGHIPVYDCLG
jgi:hypothetical protein